MTRQYETELRLHHEITRRAVGPLSENVA